jgi:hypothetical protein
MAAEKQNKAEVPKGNYYSKGSMEIATDTALTINRLETVRLDF